MGLFKDVTYNESSANSVLNTPEVALENVQRALRANDSVVQEMFKTTSENTENLRKLTENCNCNREKIDKIIKHLEEETARVSKRYDETMEVVDMYFEEVDDNLKENRELNSARLEDIDREIAEARKMQMKTHIACGIAMISSIASIILTIILA